ncbi:MAG: AAA family ATPase [Stenotrophomonas nitritireducens]|uniref:AAA family ATPase n=1 Tax=Stenotrophomonas nitritireducens TaxID=83617 RepID=UPI001AC397EB|nr:AAA family ATPase [Stenotrophomonas nitritireducens]MBN8791454.1 AAA family ATPase [Stenotrophomonas nitritireducens]MBN8795393.1 AAA family ATPase [Stenotrophomonas nitritireducens]
MKQLLNVQNISGSLKAIENIHPRSWGMKISAFVARNVHGYMNFNLSFNLNPTILVGPNGSGKTTAIRMIKALLEPSLGDLLAISFTECALLLHEGSREITISARKSSDVLSISCSDAQGMLEVSSSLLDELGGDHFDSERLIEASRMLRMKYSDNAVLKAIIRLEVPMFLGLNRLAGSSIDGASIARHYERSFDSQGMKSRQGRGVRDSLGVSLWEMQSLVTSAFRRVRSLKDAQSERLRRKLLLTGFKYERAAEGNPYSINSPSAEDLLDQRAEIIAALTEIGIEEADIKREINPFFERVFDLTSKLKHKRNPDEMDVEVVIELLLNKASLRRLTDLAASVREFNSKSEQLLSRFQSFVACMNRFFDDSGKSVEIDAVGAIKVSRPDGSNVPLDALSSGERQLLVMFGHVYFNSFGNRANAFVIDEPELSLHLRWQEVLVGEMVNSSSRAQLIIATHSPEIVGELVRHCVDMQS